MPANNPSLEAQPSKSGLTEQFEHTTQQAADKAVAQVRDARARAESDIADQRGLIAGRVRRLGGALRDSGHRLSPEDTFEREMIDAASARVQRVADYVEHASAQEMLDDLHTFARTSPGLFFGGAFLFGLGLGRFAKSSQQPREPMLGAVERDEPQPQMDRFEPETNGLDLETAGRATASGIHYSAPTIDEPPKPQPGGASREPRSVSPGEGNKS